LPAEAAADPSLLKEIVRRFKLAEPIVSFLNAGIESRIQERPQSEFLIA
jgi:hypothetical protein